RPDADNQQFTLTAVGSVPKLRKLRPPTGAVMSLGTDVVPLVRGLSEKLPAELPASGPILIGESYLPFFAVNDPDLLRPQQAHESPYYIVRREQAWKCIDDRRIGPGQGYEQVVDLGITQTLETTFEATLNINLNPSLGFTYKAVTAALGATLTANLHVT